MGCIQSWIKLVKRDPTVHPSDHFNIERSKLAARKPIRGCHNSAQQRPPPGVQTCDVVGVGGWGQGPCGCSADEREGEFRSAPSRGAPRTPLAPAAPGSLVVLHRHWSSPPLSRRGPPGVRTADPSGWRTGASPGGPRPAKQPNRNLSGKTP